MAYSTISKPSLYFSNKLYTGNGGSNSITGVGFQPDWVWAKCRDDSHNHQVFDAVRGATKRLRTDTDGAETTHAESLKSFDSDGFTMGTQTNVNQNSATYVAWNWKAGTTSIPSGSTTDPSAVSINTTAGFGIYKITAPGSGNYVLKHGLGATPKMVIVKRTDGQQKWMVWHHTFSNATDDYLQLNDNAAKATYSTCWGTMNSTDCTIATGGTLDTNGEHVIYVFTDIKGYSKFGTYKGNGNTDGAFVYTGFKPSFVMTKKTNGTGNWQIIDIARNPRNPTTISLFPDTSDVDTGTYSTDYLSNGFKIRVTTGSRNGNGDTYVYMAFAEEPLVANVAAGVPATAR